MSRSPVGLIACAVLVLAATGGDLDAGDMYWSPAPGVARVNDFAVCGSTVYAATETGLFRSQGDPDSWQELRSAWVSLVACADNRVIWEETVGLDTVVYVSHDAVQTVVAATGLADAISRGIKDLAIAGDTALVATRWGVERSTDGGLSFPAAYPVLWESSAGYQITAVWTNGAACAAAGSGGFAGQGVWRSATGAAGTWSLVLSASGQEWLDGSGSDTVVSGGLTTLDGSGYKSTNAGASWTQLPLSWGSVSGAYQRPFVSGPLILSRRVYEVFDPGSGQFLIYTNGPLFYDTDSGIGNDMDPSLASEAELRNQAIVEGVDPYLLVAEREGAVHWFRVPGGWPEEGFDFNPPFSPSLNASPRLIVAPTTTASLHPAAGGASWMHVQELYDFLAVSYDAGSNLFNTTTTRRSGPTTDGWVPYSTTLSWELFPGSGMHTFAAWYSDASGNITDPAVGTGVATFPATLTLASGGAWGTWIHARAGESFTIGVSGASGDVDVYHWEPGSTWSDDWAASTVNDTLAFTARTTGSHLICLLNWPGSATFDGSVIAQLGLLTLDPQQPSSKPAAGCAGDAPDDEPPPYYGSTEVTSFIFADGFETGSASAWSFSNS